MKPCILFYLKDSSKSFALGVLHSTVHHGVDRCHLVWRSVGMLPTHPERLDLMEGLCQVLLNTHTELKPPARSLGFRWRLRCRQHVIYRQRLRGRWPRLLVVKRPVPFSTLPCVSFFYRQDCTSEHTPCISIGVRQECRDAQSCVQTLFSYSQHMGAWYKNPSNKYTVVLHGKWKLDVKTAKCNILIPGISLMDEKFAPDKNTNFEEKVEGLCGFLGFTGAETVWQGTHGTAHGACHRAHVEAKGEFTPKGQWQLLQSSTGCWRWVLFLINE